MIQYFKPLLLTLAMIGLSLPAAADETRLSEPLFDKYAAQDGYTLINIGPNLVKFVSFLSDELSALEMIDGVRVLRAKNADAGKRLTAELTPFLADNQYTDLVDIVDSGRETTVYGIKNGDTITELLIVTHQDHTAVISVRGMLDRQSVLELKAAAQSAHCDKATAQHGA